MSDHDDIVKALRNLALILEGCLLIGGCTHNEFELVQPPDLKRHIGTKADQLIDRPPLQYRLIAYDDRLVMRAYNKSDQPIQLLGAESAVVDPAGQSHPLRSQTISPNSFIKLIFPPIRDEIYPTGPSIGFGVSSQLGRGYDPFYHYRWFGFDPWYDDPYYNDPRYLATYDDSGTYYWEWKGETEVRVWLAYQQGEKTWRDEFVFRKMKVK